MIITNNYYTMIELKKAKKNIHLVIKNVLTQTPNLYKHC